METISHKLAVFCFGVALIPATVAAQSYSNAEQAKALLDSATAHFAAAGRQQAIKDFNDKQGAFVKGDLYVFCYGPDHTMSAHGTNSGLIGKDIGLFKDADGQPFADTAWKAGIANGEATVDYRWTDPISKKIQMKTSFIKKVDEAEVCGVGFYRVNS